MQESVHPMTTDPSPPPAGESGLAFGQRNLPLLLLQARESVIRRFRPVLNANGVTEQQWRILRVLAELGPTEPRELVRLCALSSPSLTGILSRMEALELIRRDRVEADQRRVLVSMTPASRALARRLAPQVDAVYREIEQQVGHDFLRQLQDTLDQLAATLGTGPAEEE